MQKRKVKKISPEEAIQFLDDMRKLNEDRDELTKLISLRIPENLLRVLKTKAKVNNQKYQSLIISYIRLWLKN